MIDRPSWARGWFGLTGIVVLVGLCVQVWDTARLSSGHFATPLTRTLNILFFFTIESNIVLMLTCLLLGLRLTGWGKVFGPRRLASFRVAALVVIYPVVYLAVTLIRGPIVHWYPYPFVDVITHGYWHARRLSYLMGGTYHTLEWIRIVADMVFLLAGAVPLVYAALRLSFTREAKVG